MRFLDLRIACLIVLLCLSSGCDKWHKAPWQRVGEAGKWSIEVPSGLVATTTLNEDAPLQLHSPDDDFFVVVRKDLKATLKNAQPAFVLEDFLDLSIERLIQELSEPSVPTHSAEMINGLPAHIAQVEGIFKSDDILYRLAVVEGEIYQYQVLVWIRKDQAGLYLAFIDKILGSLKEE